ncbi:MAG: hypothetical protein JWO89_1979 [Verrucomicrobiaceae bacterium]|nr:hypothetical protein [Verrucomicrobiaceae bacterium]
MSFRLEMLQVARLAPRALGESTALVEKFLRSQLMEEGAFRNRDGKADLYYTVFGVEGLLALQAELPRECIAVWLAKLGDGEGLDFVHLCCLARCWSALGGDGFSETQRQRMAERIEEYRTPGGGFHAAKGRSVGSCYGCLLAAAAYEDLQLPLPRAEEVKACMDALLAPDGGWTNEPGIALAIAPATAAAMALYRRQRWEVPATCIEWLRGCCLPAGGFVAFPQAPIPDLLSTAVSLHGLVGAEADISRIKEPCLDFVDSLWNAEGGFHGNWTDDTLDCEYTYYGLLALGHLVL